ncbi:MAG: hypothetical protein O9302_03280 [Cyclobacteriaceae bacterium]|jgi:hypothetical protein|nr:hypothetical protein [Cytophagales bacterium]MCZ8327059.1 hypothetical protein [Cyclobacteriaceae bacterium]
MNLFKKGALALTLISFLSISCEQENLKPAESKIDKLTKEVLSSNAFQNLNIATSELNTSDVRFTNANENAIVISYKGLEGKKGVLALLNEKSEIRSVTYFEAITDAPADLIFSQLQEGKFNGTFVFGGEFGELRLDVEQSKVISQSAIENKNARNAKCAGITEKGGALDCAGKRIADKNWFDATICYVEFMICLAQETISCAIDGCK